MSGKDQHFGAFLKRLRLQSNHGLRRFADLIGIKASNLCDIEHDRRSMPKYHLELAADVLDLEKGREVSLQTSNLVTSSSVI